MLLATTSPSVSGQRYLAFEYDGRLTAQHNAMRSGFRNMETYAEQPAGKAKFHRRFKTIELIENDGHRSSARAASQGLGFNSALVGAYRNSAVSQDANEVGICSGRREAWMIANLASDTVNIKGFHVIYEHNRMGNTDVDEAYGKKELLEPEVQLHIFRIGQRDGRLPVGYQSLVLAGIGDELHLGGGNTLDIREEEKSSCAVSAKGGARTVGVEIHHAEIVTRLGTQEKDAVPAYAFAPIADYRRELGEELVRLLRVFKDDKVVSCAVNLGERELHALMITG